MIDVLVIGGGIHGTGVAQAAAAAGYSALLVERETLGHGTSSRSSKLIHGGLRYLESGHFGLVRESLRRYIVTEQLRAIRRNTDPLAEAQGYLTDEDIFKEVS